MPHTIHHATHAPWELVISQLETYMCVGIGPEETSPQRLWIDVEIRGFYPSYPAHIDQCIDYGMLHALVTQEWPKRPQTLLLETLVMELFAFIFTKAPMAAQATIGIFKPDIFKEAHKVGVRLALTRAEFLKLQVDKR